VKIRLPAELVDVAGVAPAPAPGVASPGAAGADDGTAPPAPRADLPAAAAASTPA
jgi:hypothetical protein